MDASTSEAAGPPARSIAVLGAGLAAAVFVAGLLWAKWLPYGAKVGQLGTSHAWSGSSILAVGGVHPGDPPSWSAALSFTREYLAAIWKALVAALLISAAVQALLPADWLTRVLNRRGRLSSAAVAGLLSTPSMMCTCCTAPVAVTLRRRGVSMAGTIAYWLGNPLLNPAVLVFLLLVAPWPWTLTRALVGVALVVGGAAVVARLTEATAPPPAQPDPEPVDRTWLTGAPARFGRALAVLTVTLVPEYVLVVMLVGAFRGWLVPLGAAGTGVLAVLLASVVGTLLVIPTAGEIPILQGLALAGLSLGAVGALLVTLPAVSLPGIAMVARTFGWRATAATTAVVAAGGLVAGALLAAL